MNIAITGTSGLAAAIAGALQSLDNQIFTPRIEDITMNGTLFYGFSKGHRNEWDVLINHAHQDFDQTKILDIAFRAWQPYTNKYIINISSRAAQPNISKGYMYSAQKASLNHLATNLAYNSDKHCRITTINLGLLNHEDLPSMSYDEVADIVKWLVRMAEFTELEVPEITVQNRANYQDVQADKQTLKEMEWYTNKS
jgi:NAD(P)-dependent dehydrogenase (short-subunit alcohol dehydrogenase family)